MTTPHDRTLTCGLTNRRSYDRARLAVTAIVWPAHEDGVERQGENPAEFRMAFIENLSLAGLSFISHTSYKLHATVWIRLSVGVKTCQFKGTVRRITPATLSGHRCHNYGVQFIRSHQTTHAQAVISSFLHSANLPQG